MKKYGSLGNLLKDYRKLNKVSQVDLATRVNVDIRTLIRWENNDTLIKPEKEEELVEETFIPYQVIRNLNAIVAIPVYYDYRIRKYSLAEMAKKIPDATWFKAEINADTERSRPIRSESDLIDVSRYIDYFQGPIKPVKKEVLINAASIIPELNHILFDTSGYYAGHSLVLPLKSEVYEKIKQKEMKEEDIDLDCLTLAISDDDTIFYGYNITADCNENLYYMLCPLLKYFKEFKGGKYIFGGNLLRSDAFILFKQFGFKVIWEDEEVDFGNGLTLSPCFIEGDFNAFLAG